MTTIHQTHTWDWYRSPACFQSHFGFNFKFQWADLSSSVNRTDLISGLRNEPEKVRRFQFPHSKIASHRFPILICSIADAGGLLKNFLHTRTGKQLENWLRYRLNRQTSIEGNRGFFLCIGISSIANKRNATDTRETWSGFYPKGRFTIFTGRSVAAPLQFAAGVQECLGYRSIIDSPVKMNKHAVVFREGHRHISCRNPVAMWSIFRDGSGVVSAPGVGLSFTWTRDRDPMNIYGGALLLINERFVSFLRA